MAKTCGGAFNLDGRPNSSPGKITCTRCVITHNVAAPTEPPRAGEFTSALAIDTSTTVYGGAFYISAGTLSLIECTVSHNRALERGGAIDIIPDGGGSVLVDASNTVRPQDRTHGAHPPPCTFH